MRGKTADPVAPVVVCSHCGRAGGPDEAGEFCGENFCRGVLQAQPEPEVPPVVEATPERPKRMPTRERDREGLAKAFLFVAVVVLVVAVLIVVFWPSDDGGEPVVGEPVATATASPAEGQMGEEEKPPESQMPADEEPMPADGKSEPKSGEMGMADTGAAKDHTRTMRQSAHQWANGYLAWSYGIWRTPPGLFAAGTTGAAYAQVDHASGWAGESDERPEITEFEAKRKSTSENVASAHIVAGRHVIDLVLQRHTTGSMKNWLQIPVTNHMRPIWRVTTVVDASA